MSEKKPVFGEKGYTNLMSLEEVLASTNVAAKADALGLGSDAFKTENLPRTTCSKCHENKVRIPKKTPKKSTRKFYEDEGGRPWNGLSCADCTRLKAKEHMREKRAKNKEVI